MWDEYKQTMLNDWAAPAIQYCRALETEIKRRLHDYYPDAKYHYPDIDKTGFDVPFGNMTLGAVETIYRLMVRDRKSAKDKNEEKRIQTGKNNWNLCCILVTRSGGDISAFEALLKQMVDEHVTSNRNEIAHGKPIAQSTAQELREAIIGRKGKAGILYRLVECLEPKK